MEFTAIVTLLIVLAAIFGYVNIKYLKFPVTIGLMVVSILFSVVIFLAGYFYTALPEMERMLVSQIDFSEVLLEGMLSFLLFAGALHVDLGLLREQKWPIILFATLGVLTSTFLVGGLTYLLLQLLDIGIPFIYCLLFGSLISPTDPIAVLGILKEAGVPKKLETKIVGESLFNDGIGVVIFITILGIAKTGVEQFHFSEIGLLFVEEVGGGIGLGFLLGFMAYYLMKSIDNYEVEVLITLAIVMGGYWLASSLHFSGPLAMVVAGLVVGTERFRTTTMSETTELYVDKFWELIDVLFNAVLFVLIGLEIVVLSFESQYIVAGLLAIPLVLLSRFAALGLPIAFFKRKLEFVPKTNLIMTWGGLRGGISIALALSLPVEMSRDLLLTITYIIVVFSIVVQGLSLEQVVKKVLPTNSGTSAS